MASEHPILFTGAMVRAILDGTKTQTRRVITVPWHKGKRCLPYEPYYVETDGKLSFEDEYGDFIPMEKLCPYGVPGDTLWVRETWAPLQQDYKRRKGYGQPRLYKADATPTVHWCTNEYGCHAREPEAYEGAMPKWRPSIHMPRWASRITLGVTDVRVERVQSISEEDAFAEGISGGDWLGNPAGEFAKLWDSINAKRGYAWGSNPWVWVVTFKKVKGA